MPGSLGELRPLIVIVSFLGLFALFIAMIPTEFYAGSYEGRELEVPDYFESSEMQYFADTWNWQMNETGGYSLLEMYHIDVDHNDDGLIGNHQIQMVYSEANRTHHNIEFVHVYYQWVIFPADHNMIFKYKGSDRGTVLTDTDLDADMGSDGEATYQISCDHLAFYTSLGYNTTIYNNATHAWDHHGIYVFAGIDFDQVNTGLNAWNIIGMILFFQMPDVHPAINAIIAVPLWIAIAYLAYVLILKAIPFVSG